MSKTYPRICFVNQTENYWLRITNILLCDSDDILITVFQQIFRTMNSATNYIPLIS